MATPQSTIIASATHRAKRQILVVKHDCRRGGHKAVGSNPALLHRDCQINGALHGGAHAPDPDLAHPVEQYRSVEQSRADKDRQRQNATRGQGRAVKCYRRATDVRQPTPPRHPYSVRVRRSSARLSSAGKAVLVVTLMSVYSGLRCGVESLTRSSA